ncbi:MAG: DUF3341 domain-containing protein [Phycisphaerales bacterium]|nr:DUF3341 domain-containing protein [Phycisphaerales bacterium]
MTTAAPPLLDPRHSYASITDRIVEISLRRNFPFAWVAMVGIAFSVVGLMMVSILWLLSWGVGVWGINIPVAWAFAITNFVWWIGIGHAGTLISAILLLMRQPWRNSISRFAEAMTLFAVANAGLFPLLHLGRIWKFFYLFPYPDTLGLWPQWRSPLVWDVIAVLTYFTVSLLFWYLGLLPDLASMRDAAARRWVRVAAGIAALGWRGSARHWQRYQMAYLLLAGLATPLVVSVHSIVSLDFSVALVPGWHTTIFPPYFVAGAIFSGFAMVLTLAIPLRSAFGLQDFITARHLDCMAKVMLANGLIVAYGYLAEDFTAWYSGDLYEVSKLRDHLFGGGAALYWAVMFCNVLVTQALWFRRVRTRPLPLLLVALVINVGMWLERYDIIVGSLSSDFMPSAFGGFSGTFWDWSLLAGSLGLFTLLFLVFIRVVPMMSMFELRDQLFKERRAAGSGAPRDDHPRTHAEVAPPSGPLHGVLAEFHDAQSVTGAARSARAAGYRDLDAYTPFPVEDLPEALGLPPTRIPLLVLACGILAGASAYFLMWYSAVIDFPWNIGGRPLNSWPSFIPITFEITVLGGALGAFFGVLAGSGLPLLYHPVFNVPGFERATRDRFFLCVRTSDAQAGPVHGMLRALGPIRVSEVRGPPP